MAKHKGRFKSKKNAQVKTDAKTSQISNNNKSKANSSVPPPKLKSISKENISCNWKTLLQSSELSSEIEKAKKKKKNRPHFNDYTQESETIKEAKPSDGLVKENSFTGLTKVIGMDCEMVGVGWQGKDSILARVSIVNHFGNTILDTFVAPREKVIDYRTTVSGVRPEDLKGAPSFESIQKQVSEILSGRILVGHAIQHDLKVLFLSHPKKRIRDTSKYKPFRGAFGGRTPSLKNLSSKYLGVTVQTGEHSSVQDAQAAVRLYTMFRREWESAIAAKKSGGSGTAVVKKKTTTIAASRTQLNNKSDRMLKIQQDLSQTGVKRYVDSDSDSD